MNRKLFGRKAAKGSDAAQEPRQVLIQPDGTTIPIVPIVPEDSTEPELPDTAAADSVIPADSGAAAEIAVPEDVAGERPLSKKEKRAAKKAEKQKKKAARKRTLGVRKGLTGLQKGLIIGASILGVFIIAAIVMYVMSGAGKKVYVVNIGEITEFNSYMNENSSYGTVKAENLQAQYVSESLHVNEILVKEGDRVKIGDLVMTYDTTLDSLEVDKKALKCSEMELELINLKRQLAIINSMKPHDPNAEQPTVDYDEPEEYPTGEVVLTYKILDTDAEGSEDDPFICVLAGSDIPTEDLFLNVVLGKTSPAYVVFENRTANMTGGRVREAWGVCFTGAPGALTSISFFDASDYIYVYEPGEPEPVEEDSGYTAAEIAKMRVDTQNQITEKDLEVRMAKVEVAQMRNELSGGEVYSKVDGVVKAVRTEEEARDTGEPVLLISGGGGFSIEGSISELMLDTVNIGDSVTVMSFENGMTYDGTVTNIIDLPVENDMYFGDGAAASYYPVTVFVSEDSNLREYEYVSINYDSEVKNAKYLESMFVLNENGSSYVYAVGSDGLLEKRKISTGGTMYGYLTQVRSGLSDDDYVAFPYGNNVRSGAKVEQCTIDEFYSKMYGY